MSEKVLMKGNEAFAEAAIRGGCRYYFGYPITPQNELIEYLSVNLPLVGGDCLQAESELASINMAYGAAMAGGRVLTSSSSPGIALMQEGISFMCSTEIPCVLLNVSRGGPGVGSIQPGQADYFQATRGGGNGDYRVIVLAPYSIQEAVDIIPQAFEYADKYRNPVMVLVDGMIGQMMEPVVLPESVPAMDSSEIFDKKPWALTAKQGKRDHNVIKSLYLKSELLEEKNNSMHEKYEMIKKELPQYEATNLEDADIVFVAYGSMARIVTETIELLAEDGIKAGLIRPITLWPYPYNAFDEVCSSTKLVVSAELSQGQMIDDVKIGVNGRFETRLVGRSGGIIITSYEVADKAKAMLKEVE